ncbi:MAG: Omp28-related outer membrane protein [bacterium]|nr:Omp28-related outer membrane protein [bacterium]
MSFIEYHNFSGLDIFTTTETTNRETVYYGNTSHPAVYSDGVIKRSEGVAGNYGQYRTDFNARKVISSPLLINISGGYDSGTRQGTVTACIRNTSGAPVIGTLQFVIVENNIAHTWQMEDSLFFVARDMLPSEAGELVTVPVGDSITKSRSFTMDASWVKGNCEIVVFVQMPSTKEVYQSAKEQITNFGVEEQTNSNFGLRNLELKIGQNPFSNSTIINYFIPSTNTSQALLTIYDISGKLVKSFPITQSPNNQMTSLTWDGKDNTGKTTKAGIYFAHLSANDFSISRKIVKTR